MGGQPQQPQQRQRKPSRFLRSNSNLETAAQPSYERQTSRPPMRMTASPSPPPGGVNGGGYRSLADEVLSGGRYDRMSGRGPAAEDDGYSRYSTSGRRREPSSDRYGGFGAGGGGRRDTGYGRRDNRDFSPDDGYAPLARNGGGRRNSRFNDDFEPNPRGAGSSSRYGGYDRGSPEGYAPRGRSNRDDDDFDGMIADLKKKTTGRDMLRYVSQIEGRDVTPPRESGRFRGAYDDDYADERRGGYGGGGGGYGGGGGGGGGGSRQSRFGGGRTSQYADSDEDDYMPPASARGGGGGRRKLSAYD